MNKAGRIGIVGAGMIGQTVAYTLMLKGLASQIVLANRDIKKAGIKAFDMSHCLPQIEGIHITYRGLEELADSEIIVFTAGILSSPTGTRMDILKNNLEIYKEIMPAIAKNNPQAMFIMVTNPVDVISYAVQKISGFPSSRVIGSGTLLDSLRFR